MTNHEQRRQDRIQEQLRRTHDMVRQDMIRYEDKLLQDRFGEEDRLWKLEERNRAKDRARMEQPQAQSIKLMQMSLWYIARTHSGPVATVPCTNVSSAFMFALNWTIRNKVGLLRQEVTGIRGDITNLKNNIHCVEEDLVSNLRNARSDLLAETTKAQDVAHDPRPQTRTNLPKPPSTPTDYEELKMKHKEIG